jgi:hypothetical protein
MSDLTMRVDSEEYLLRREDDGLRVGRSIGGDVTWLDTVDLGLLPGPAREALESGDTSDESLLTAVRGVVQAEVERGG